MAFYDEMQNVASGILAEFKQGTVRYMQLVQSGGTEDEPGTSTLTPYDVDATIKGVSYKYVKDGLALSTDLTATIAVKAGLTPNMRDFIENDGVLFKIVQDISTPAAGTRVVWKYIIRKG